MDSFISELSIEPCEQNPYQNAYYEAVYTLGRAISEARDKGQGSDTDIFNATALLQHFTGPFDMWRYNNRASLTDVLRYEERKFIDRDLDVSLSVHQFYRAKVLPRGEQTFFHSIKIIAEEDEPEEKVECWRNLDKNHSQNLTVCPKGTCLSKLGIHNQPLWHECWYTNRTSDLIDTGFCPCSFAEMSSTECNFEKIKNFLRITFCLFIL